MCRGNSLGNAQILLLLGMPSSVTETDSVLVLQGLC